MQLTKFSDYSLRALTYLGLNGGRRCTVREIAGACGIPESHLVQVIHNLGRRGFVATSRGRNGGLELARPAREINLGEVLRATETNFEMAECFAADGKNSCPIAGTCELTHVLEMALRAFFDVLDRHTLEDLLSSETELKDILMIEGGRH